MAEFIDYARQHPGEITYSSPGIGTAHHLYGEVLNKVAGIKMVNVPYKGVAPALTDLLGGHVQAGIISLAAALPQVQSGQIRALAMFDTKRYPALPNVPTITEVLPQFELARSWVGFMGPPDLPPAITARLHAEITQILRSSDVSRNLAENGLEVVANSPDDFAAVIRRDTKLWEAVATDAGLVTPR
jgi:tripartite-type tricarboxylate transporter receptor subunit TctC